MMTCDEKHRSTQATRVFLSLPFMLLSTLCVQHRLVVAGETRSASAPRAGGAEPSTEPPHGAPQDGSPQIPTTQMENRTVRNDTEMGMKQKETEEEQAGRQLLEALEASPGRKVLPRVASNLFSKGPAYTERPYSKRRSKYHGSRVCQMFGAEDHRRRRKTEQTVHRENISVADRARSSAEKLVVKSGTDNVICIHT